MAQLHPLIGQSAMTFGQTAPTHSRVDIQCLLGQRWRSDEYRHSVPAHSINTSQFYTCFLDLF